MPERHRGRGRNKRHGENLRHPKTTEKTPAVKFERIPAHVDLLTPKRGKERLLLAVALGAMDLFSRRYNLHGSELLSSYGHDFLGVPLWWTLTQGIFPKSEFFRSKKNIALGTFLSYGFEGFQYYLTEKAPTVFEQHIFGWGRFAYDPNDLLAYTLGAGVALGLHRLLSRKRTN